MLTARKVKRLAPALFHYLKACQCEPSIILKAKSEIIRKNITQTETEDTWNTIAEGISQLTMLCLNGGCNFVADLIHEIRFLSRPLNNAMKSERSRLSGTAIDLLSVLATELGPSFEPLVPAFLPTILGLCGRTNKVFTSRAKACILTMIEHTQLPCILKYLTDLAIHKSASSRLMAAEGVLACLNSFNPPDLERDARACAIEDFIKVTAGDANSDVRKVAKEIFFAYKTLMPMRSERCAGMFDYGLVELINAFRFIALLTPEIKKYLSIQAKEERICTSASTATVQARKQLNDISHSARAWHIQAKPFRPPSTAKSFLPTGPAPQRLKIPKSGILQSGSSDLFGQRGARRVPLTQVNSVPRKTPLAPKESGQLSHVKDSRGSTT